MTANRWWVRLAARWLARIDGVKGQVQMFSLAVTAFSTFSIMLQGFGLGRYVPYLGAIAAVVGTLYVYLYAEGGVWNQVQRDRQDMSNNWAGPNSKIQSELIARSVIAAQRGEELSETEREAVRNEAHSAFVEYRNGTDLDD
jgi:uncharacterized membrane protein